MATRDKEMSILEHFEELRMRLFRAIIFLVLGILIGLLLAPPAIEYLLAPLENIPQAISPTEPIEIIFKIATVIGVILAMPFMLYQALQFVVPAMTPEEKKVVRIGVPAAALSFAIGAIFAGMVLIPAAIGFMQGILQDVIEHQYTPERYLALVGNLMLWTGLIFETPLVMYILAKIGVVTHEGFAKARKIVYIASALGAAIITPTTDIINMILVMVPFMVLYEIGTWLAYLAQLNKERSNK